MVSLSSIALSGMHAAQTQLRASAHNVANLNTAGFSRQEVTLRAQTGGGVSAGVTTAMRPGPSLESDVIAQLQAKNAFLSNLAVFKTQDKLAGTLLNLDA